MSTSALVCLPLDADADARTDALTRCGLWTVTGPQSVRAHVKHRRGNGCVTVQRDRSSGQYEAHAEFDDGTELDASADTFDGAVTSVQAALDAAEQLDAAGE